MSSKLVPLSSSISCCISANHIGAAGTDIVGLLQAPLCDQVAIGLHGGLIADKGAFAVIGIGIDVIKLTVLAVWNENPRRYALQARHLLRRVGFPHCEAGVLQLHVGRELRQGRHGGVDEADRCERAQGFHRDVMLQSRLSI